MSNDKTRRHVIQAAAALATVGLAGCGGDAGRSDTETDDGSMSGNGSTQETDNGSMQETTTSQMSEPVGVTVRIENVAPTDFYDSDTHTNGAIWLTPGAYAIHMADNPIFTDGEPASIGLEGLAEAGPPTGFPDEPGLIEELQGMTGSMCVASAGTFTPENTVSDPNDPQGAVPGAPPVAPGGAFEFRVEARPGMKLSFASMYVPSNDVFVSPGSDGISLWPMDGEPIEGDVTDEVRLWDAGTEPNAEPPGQGSDQAPAQDSPDQGDDEDAVVRPLSDVDDGYQYPDVTNLVKVTLTPGGSMSGEDGGSMGSGNGSTSETDGMGS
jgi:hypothetical protein